MGTAGALTPFLANIENMASNPDRVTAHIHTRIITRWRSMRSQPQLRILIYMVDEDEGDGHQQHNRHELDYLEYVEVHNGVGFHFVYNYRYFKQVRLGRRDRLVALATRLSR